MADDLPEPDRIEGAPHPRETQALYGQAPAEAAFLEAFRAGRMHHAWMLTGPRGVGKATLAWRIARFLLAGPQDAGGLFAPEPPATLDVAPENPVARRIAALSEPRLFLLRRGANDKGDALTRDITVGEVRRMKAFFQLSAADGGTRVAIVDAADDLNTNAANALLKLLEEPPARVLMLLVTHQPARLLPTIRSRCRVLPLAPLGPGDLARAVTAAGGEAQESAALAELAGGSVGAALGLAEMKGPEVYARILRLLDGMPGLDRVQARALADASAGRGKDAVFEMTLGLIEQFLARLSRRGATGQAPIEAAPGEAALLARLAPDAQAARAWAELAQVLGRKVRQGRAVNLDPSALLLDMLLAMDAAAGKTAQG